MRPMTERNTDGDDRSLVQCDGCGRLYPAFRTSQGYWQIMGEASCTGCGGESFSEVTDPNV